MTLQPENTRFNPIFISKLSKLYTPEQMILKDNSGRESGLLNRPTGHRPRGPRSHGAPKPETLIIYLESKGQSLLEKL